MPNGNESVDVKLPTGETITAVVPSGWSDEQIHANLLAKHPEFFRQSEASQVSARPGQVAPTPVPNILARPAMPGTSRRGMPISTDPRSKLTPEMQASREEALTQPAQGLREISQGQVKTGLSDVIEGGGKLMLPVAAMGAPFGPAAALGGLAGGTAAAKGTELVSNALGASPETTRLASDVAGIGGGIVGGMGGELAGKIPGPKALVRSLTSTTPERLAQLGQVEGKIADVHELVTKAEQAVHGAVSSKFPDVKTPVELPSQYSVGGWQNGKFITAEDLKPRQIPFIQAQQEFSQLSQDARAVHIARSRGLATGFDEEAILARKNALGQAMQDAASKDGQLPQYLAAKARFQQFMNDFHNRGSAVEPLLNMKPDETSRIAGHLLSPDKGARLVETLQKYGVNTSKIDDLLKGGGTNLKIDVNEAAKLRKLGAAYPESRLNESIDQAKFNRLQSSAQARLPAWAMRKSANIPGLPDAISPNIPVRSLVRWLLESSMARKAVKP